MKPPYEYEVLETCRKVHLVLAPEQRFRLVLGEELLAGRGSWQLCSGCGTMLFYVQDDGRKFCLASTLERHDLLPGALHNAAESDAHRPKVLEFLQRGFAVDAEIGGKTPLMCAARRGNIDSFRILLDRGANPHRAVEASAISAPNAVPLQRLLLEAGCDRQEMLSATAASARVEAVELVLRAGAKVNLPDSKGRLPLYRACQNSVETVQTLLAHGADPSLLNGNGSRPLNFCATFNLTDRLQALLEAGAPVNAMEGNTGQSPLYAACCQGRMCCARLLLDHGADPNLGCQTTTPLMAASRYGSLALVELLLERGADSSRINAAGYSAKDLAHWYLPDLLTRATEAVLKEKNGRVQHRWCTSENGERCLKLRQRGAIYCWNDCHAEIVKRLS